MSDAIINKGPDGFEYSNDHPRFAAHQLLDEYLKEIPSRHDYYNYNHEENSVWQKILAAHAELRAETLRACFERRETLIKEQRLALSSNYMRSVYELMRILMRQKLPFTEEDLLFLLNPEARYSVWSMETHLIKAAKNHVDKHGLTEPMRECLQHFHKELSFNQTADRKRFADRVAEIIGESKRATLEPGESWADASNETLKTLSAKEAETWSALIAHCKSATAGKPSAKWLKEANPQVEEVGFKNFSEHLQKWLKLFAAHHQQVNETNLDALKGLVWCASLQSDIPLLRAIAHVVPACVKNIEHRTTYEYAGETHEYANTAVRAPRLANACLWVLSQSDEVEAVGLMARLRLKVRHRGILGAIEKAVEQTAQRLNVAPEELEELATPDFGLQDGKLHRTWNGYEVTIEFPTGKAQWLWQDENGKTLKAPPAAIKREYSNELKELKTTVSEIEKTLTVVKERLDLTLRQERSWNYDAWRERYLEHPLLGQVSRRVIWEWEQNNKRTIGIWHDNGFVDHNGASVATPNEGATLRLWHPINATPEVVAAWRNWLERSSTRQPFKQAHREIYILTDAERTTRTYSNRFAAHIIRQHQFNSLCVARGWKNQLRLMVDDEYPPATKFLPQHNLRAEFWVEGIGDSYGEDTNDTGTYWRLATDQVRFYRMDSEQNRAHAGGGGYGAARWGQTPAEPLPLEEIPPLVFSEVMRDVDLFVGVASVGNDPTWSDGGPQGRFVNYWNEYSWGDLGETAQTRRDVLSRLLPRLKIVDRCTLEDKWLKVRGDLKTYKIHLGSGNILMEPNNQYLCIVPARGQSPDSKVFLPFEGDQTMAIILSKAFLLADDTKITDASIVSQIKS